MLDNSEKIGAEELLSTVSVLKYKGYRFVTASCADNRDGTLDLYYHFDKDLELKNLALTVRRDEPVPSLTGLYLCAFLVENELKELFGLNIENIAIDYGGRMFLTGDAPESPMAWGANIVTEQKKEEE